MHLEVDQSGKIEDTRTHTVLAFSNEIQYSILIPVQVKRECVTTLRGRFKSGKIFYLRLFIVGLFLLLKDHLHEVTSVTIDVEYEGKERDIRRLLLFYLRRIYPYLEKDVIGFRRIGKSSNAHKVAIETFRGRREPDKVIRAEEILRWFP